MIVGTTTSAHPGKKLFSRLCVVPTVSFQGGYIKQHQFPIKERVKTWPKGTEAQGSTTEGDRMRSRPVTIPGAVNLVGVYQNSA
jgi:hypothetical protein